MKTKIKSIFAILLFCILAFNYSDINAQGTVRIQADPNALIPDLEVAATIITNRLHDFSPDKFDLIVDKDKKEITVQLLGYQNPALVRKLMTAKGKLAFYETWNRKEVKELSGDNGKLFEMLNQKLNNDDMSELGCIAKGDTGKIMEYLRTLKINKPCLFAWTRFVEGGSKCLYALKTGSNNDGVITEADLSKAEYNLDKNSSRPEILIEMKKGSVPLWADMTKKNINRCIAIAMDGEILSAPMVMNEIKEGRSKITGNFTVNEAKYIAALCNNGALPLTFKLIE